MILLANAGKALPLTRRRRGARPGLVVKLVITNLLAMAKRVNETGGTSGCSRPNGEEERSSRISRRTGIEDAQGSTGLQLRGDVVASIPKGLGRAGRCSRS
jgi:hypothetical protein